MKEYKYDNGNIIFSNNETIEFCSKPLEYKNFIYFISPFEWEMKGNLIKYDLNEGAIIGELGPSQSDYTFKNFLMKNDYIYMIIGYMWGTVNEGGNIYRCDMDFQNFELVKEFNDKVQVVSLESKGENVITLKGYRYTSDDYLEREEYYNEILI